jgi:hypothetical protein
MMGPRTMTRCPRWSHTGDGRDDEGRAEGLFDEIGADRYRIGTTTTVRGI